MDLIAVKTMVESGHATAAHLARHFQVSLKEMEQFLQENDIPRPTAVDPQFRHITKLASAQRPEMVPWEDLVFDDAEHRFLNGIDLDTIGEPPRVNAKEIFRYYFRGEPRCFYTGQEVDSLMAFDTNPQNFLISNLVPAKKEIADARGFEGILPMMVVSKTYKIPNLPFAGIADACGTEITINLLGRFDPTYGAVLNEPYLDATIEQWVDPYLGQHQLEDLMPEHTPVTAETLVLWLWRHLSTVAFLKGLVRLDVKYREVTATLTKDLYLQMVTALMQRAVQSRAIASHPSGLVMPTQADVANITQHRSRG